MIIPKILRSVTTALPVSAGIALPAGHSMENPVMRGAAMFADRTLVKNAVTSADHPIRCRQS